MALVSSEAQAQNASAEARAAFQEGVRQFSDRHFAEALEAFRRAYRTRPHPSVLVNIANCYLALEDPRQAISYFERFLGDPTNNASPQQRGEIQQALLNARRRLAQVQVFVQPAGAEVFVDGDLVGSAPLRRPLELGPGPHVIEARHQGSVTQQYQARLEPGAQLTITLDLVQGRSFVGSVPTPTPTPVVVAPPPTPVVVAPPPTPVVVAPPPTPVVVAPPPTPVVVAPPPTPVVVTPPPPVVVAPPSDRPLDLRVNDGVVAPRARGPGAGFWITLGLTVGFGATATGFAVYAENLATDFQVIARAHNAAPPGQQRDLLYQQATNYAQAVDQNRTIAIIMGGAAGASAIAAVILLATGGSNNTRRPVTVSPAAAGHGAALNVTF
jgi:tetratricopeptide (TPR) repeat protein